MEGLFKRRLKRFFLLRIDLPALLAFAFFAGLIFFYLIPGFEKAMMERKRALIHEITSSAYSILEYYHSLEKQGNLTDVAAKEQARSAIGAIRYGNNLKDYFWITDRHPRMIVHPYKPELNGKDLTDFRDSKGKTIFVDFVKAVSTTGESYVEYMWQWNDDSTRIVPKLSYVKMFEPWGWIVGTGIYIDDVRSEIRNMEFRALIISGIIGLVIIMLLIAISRQSHTMEEKRNKAEAALKKSRELYRTLAEAASEGVIIWSEQGLQANKILLSWLGYTEAELQHLAFQEIFNSAEIPNLTSSDKLYDELSSRRFVDCVLTMNNGNSIKSHADFSRILLGGMKAVLLVIRPAKTFDVQPDFSPRTKLLDGIGTGFFRTTYGKKIRFLYASKPTVELLGFVSLQDLYLHAVEALFVNPAHFKIIRSALALKEDLVEKTVLLRRKSGDTSWFLISIAVVESDSGELCCEGTLEQLAAATFQKNAPLADLATYGASYIMEAPVSDFMHPGIECRESLSVMRTVSVMKENHTDMVIVTNNNGEPMGVIDAALIGFRLAEGGSPETEIFRWMSAPPEFIHHRATLNEAFRMIQKSLKKYLLVTTNNHSIEGILSQADLSIAFFTAPRLIISEIGIANSSSALNKIFHDSHTIAISMLLGHADPYAISLFLSSIADAICQRVISLCMESAGDPPCRFAFIQTGSAGRKEQTFSTDQDNAIIFENCEGEKLVRAHAYFTALGKSVNKMLSQAGFRLCIGNNMAGNPKWCQPLDNWKKYFSTWINIPGPSELLEVSIFFDFGYCFGDKSLSDALREYIQADLKASDIFFHHLSTVLKQFNPSIRDLSGETMDIKKLLLPLTGIIRLYALKYGTDGYSTIERILALHEGKYMDAHLLREALKAWKDLTSLRLSHQASCIQKGIEPDNRINIQISDNENIIFAEQAMITINNMMLKTGTDFYTAEI